jgi:dienelactone hydrolase
MTTTRFALRTSGIICLILLSLAPAVAQDAANGGYRVFRPDGPGPHPAVLFLSGCDGFKPAYAPASYERPAEELRALGFVVVWVDYLGRRNLPDCTSGVTEDEAGRDAVAAASWLNSQRDVDPKRITAMGWSYGGGSVLAALADDGIRDLVFKQAILYYPYCAAVGPRYHRIPVLVLRGGLDPVPQSCELALKVALKGGSGKGSVKVIVYPGAIHGFDFSVLPPKIHVPHGTMGYDPKAAAAAWKEVLRFLGVGK